MKPMLPITILLAVPALLAAGCTAEAEPLASAENENTSASNCSFIPGCKHLLEATDGPFSASVMTYEDAGGNQRRSLSVTYREPLDSSFLLCRLFPRQPAVSSVFVVGPEGARSSLSHPMSVSCPRSWGDNGGQSNYASFGIVEDENTQLWDTLFPPQADGSRWYALQVAATNERGDWDSRFGENYRLVLRPH